MLHQSDLAYILRENVSQGLYDNLNNEKPFTERSQEEIYKLVIAHVAQPKVIGTWKLWNSLTDKEGVFQNAEEQICGKISRIMKCNSSTGSRKISSPIRNLLILFRLVFVLQF